MSIFSFGGPLSFGAAADLGHHVREEVKPGSRALLLDFTLIPVVDVSAAMAVQTITSDAIASGRTLLICGANEQVEKVLESINAHHQDIPTFATRREALEAAVKIVESGDGNDGETVFTPKKLAELK